MGTEFKYIEDLIKQDAIVDNDVLICNVLLEIAFQLKRIADNQRL